MSGLHIQNGGCMDNVSGGRMVVVFLHSVNWIRSIDIFYLWI